MVTGPCVGVARRRAGTVPPSPKFHAYDTTLPSVSEAVEPSKVIGEPEASKVNAAVGKLLPVVAPL